jgi:hypothetical protein
MLIVADPLKFKPAFSTDNIVLPDFCFHLHPAHQTCTTFTFGPLQVEPFLPTYFGDRYQLPPVPVPAETAPVY